MGASGWVHLDFERILRGTLSALLVEFEEGSRWIPRSQIADNDYSVGDGPGVISVSEWWAQKENLQ